MSNRIIFIIVGGNMFTYNMEYRERVLFIRLIGSLDNNIITYLDKELDTLVNQMGITNIVFNLSEVDKMSDEVMMTLVKWYQNIKERKGVSFVCGIKHIQNKQLILRHIQEVSSELNAIRVINWKNSY